MYRDGQQILSQPKFAKQTVGQHHPSQQDNFPKYNRVVTARKGKQLIQMITSESKGSMITHQAADQCMYTCTYDSWTNIGSATASSDSRNSRFLNISL